MNYIFSVLQLVVSSGIIVTLVVMGVKFGRFAGNIEATINRAVGDITKLNGQKVDKDVCEARMRK